MIEQFYSNILPEKGSFLCASNEYPDRPSGSQWVQSFPQGIRDKLIQGKRPRDLTNARISICSFSTTARRITTAQYARALFIDIDTHGKDSYETFDDAMAAYKVAHKALGLPRPWFSATGGGLHLFYPLSEDIEVTEWRSLNRALAVALHEANVLVDMAASGMPTVSTRLIGSHNVRSDKTVGLMGSIIAEVKTKEYWTDKLSAFIQTEDVVKTQEYQAPNKSSEQIIKGCQQVREAPFQDEPVWHRMFTILERCVDGEEFVHKLSAQDPRYSEYTTSLKWDSVNRNNMPARCKEFEYQRSEVCNKCPSYGKVKSPVELGRIRSSFDIACDTLEVLVLPEPDPSVAGEYKAPTEIIHEYATVTIKAKDDKYFQNEDGVFLNTKVKDPEDPEGGLMDVTLHLTSSKILPKAIICKRDTYGNPVFATYWRIYSTKTTYHDYEIENKSIHSNQELMNALGSYGCIVTNPKNFNHMGVYMRMLSATSIETLPHIPIYTSFGWCDDAFVLADYVFRPENSYETPKSDRLMGYAAMLGKSGTFEGWKKGFDLFAAPGMEREAFILAQAFAAPLMRFTGVNGICIHLDGDSGAGKSTLQKLILGVWGNHDKMFVRATGSKTGATQNYTAHTIGVFQNLPFAIDEITNSEAEWCSDFIYSFSMGHERGRLKNSEDAQIGKSWQSVAITSANGSLIEKMATHKNDIRAEVLRMFEFKFVTDRSGEDRAWIKRMSSLNEALRHYGHAGIIYARWLVSNIEALQQEVDSAYQELSVRFNATQQERIWFAGLAATWVGLKISRQAGLHSFNIDAVMKWAGKMIEEQRMKLLSIDSCQATAEDMLGQFMAKNHNEMFIVRTQATPKTPADEINYTIARPRNGASARVELLERRIIISKAAIKTWCTSRKISLSKFYEVLARTEGVEIEHGADSGYRTNLARGVPNYHVLPNVICISIIVSDVIPFISKVVEEDDLSDEDYPEYDVDTEPQPM